MATKKDDPTTTNPTAESQVVHPQPWPLPMHQPDRLAKGVSPDVETRKEIERQREIDMRREAAPKALPLGQEDMDEELKTNQARVQDAAIEKERVIQGNMPGAPTPAPAPGHTTSPPPSSNPPPVSAKPSKSDNTP